VLQEVTDVTPRLRLPLGGIPLLAAGRPSRGARLALLRLLLVLATILLPYGTAAASDPEPLPSDSASASATREPSLAGTVAGEGRTRPGRPQGPAAQVEGQNDDDPDDATATEPDETAGESPAATSSPPAQEAGLVPPTAPQQARPAHQAVAHGEDGATEPVLHILPLGSGLVLIGLGLGLAFIGLRVRRS
jgi:hypothetical protein